MLGRKSEGKPHPETCEKCPHRFSERGCPCWVKGVVETNIQTGEVRSSEGCFYQMFPKWIVHVLQASNRPAAALESLRNEMVQRQDAALERLMALPLPFAPMLEITDGQK